MSAVTCGSSTHKKPRSKYERAQEQVPRWLLRRLSDTGSPGDYLPGTDGNEAFTLGL